MKYQYFLLNSNTESMIFNFTGTIENLYKSAKKQAKNMGMTSVKIRYKNIDDNTFGSLDYEIKMRKAK